jgi:hypothetical protein
MSAHCATNDIELACTTGYADHMRKLLNLPQVQSDDSVVDGVFDWLPYGIKEAQGNVAHCA